MPLSSRPFQLIADLGSRIPKMLGRGGTLGVRNGWFGGASSPRRRRALIRAEPLPSGPRPLYGLTLVVIDGDPASRGALRAMLSSLGGLVLEARNIAEGLRLVAAAMIPDLVLCDVTLPEMADIARARRIRTDRPRETRLVALLPERAHGAVRHLWSAGFEGVLVRPITVEKLRRLARFCPPRARLDRWPFGR
jgi:CheY-like chemotaxis protein